MTVLFTKAGAFIAGENAGGKNYRFEKVLFGPQSNLGQAVLNSLARRVTKENLPLMKVNLNGDSVTYYANYGQHVVVYHLEPGETISVESENILASRRTVTTVYALSVSESFPERACTLYSHRQRKDAYVCSII